MRSSCDSGCCAAAYSSCDSGCCAAAYSVVIVVVAQLNKKAQDDAEAKKKRDASVKYIFYCWKDLFA